MDLPLARCGPSPPYRLRKELRLARRCPSALSKLLCTKPHNVRATRARLQFVGRTHRKRIHSCMAADVPRCAREPRWGQLKRKFAAAGAVISPARFIVKKRMTLFAIFLIFSSSWLLRRGKDHVFRFLGLAAAVFHIQSEVVFDDIVALVEA